MRFSEVFNINKSQSELDFVDVDLSRDAPLFIDPYAISKRKDLWSAECHNKIVRFFQFLVDAIRNDDENTARHLLSRLGESNDTRFGLSIGRPQGRGIGNKQATDLYEKLRESSAVKTGFLRDLSDCELVVPGISRDKISDIITNVIKYDLIKYTLHQCFLHNIEIKDNISSGFYWNQDRQEWDNNYFLLPSYNDLRIILVPKVIARYDFSYDHQEYYNHYVLNFLQAEELNINSSLVKMLKKGIRKVYKTDLKEKYPCSKEFLYKFSREHPGVLEKYKNSRTEKPDISNEEIIEDLDEKIIANSLINDLETIPKGNDGASAYHSLMKGILEFIFYPNLIYPQKEQEINEGRKRIDIMFTNAAREGIFYRLHSSHNITCPYIAIECKNYTRELANPELDQLIGRFSANMGKVGIRACRDFQDKKLFIKRCRDTAQQQLGIIMPFDDEDINFIMLKRANKDFKGIDKFLDERLRQVLL